MTEIPLTIEAAASALRDGTLTSTELTTASLALADRLDRPGGGEPETPALGTYLQRLDEQALASAAAADAAFAAGEDAGPLQGIPLGIKDIISLAGSATTAQSLILDPAWGGRGDAPVVARLRAAGAVFTGKVTTMEFAIGMPDAEKPFPIPRNPWSLDRWPGGSSSGTGSGVAAGLFLGGLGTDTGGSIRCPAAYCGISGIKATFGRVPKSGCVPLGYSYDNIGPMARSALDCALMLNVMAGYDATDPYAADVPVPDHTAGLTGDLTGVRLAVDKVHTVDREVADPAVREALDAAIAVLVAAGATVEEISLPLYDELTTATMIGMFGEAFAYHRNDLAARWGDYGRGTRLGVVNGALFTGADYAQAQRVRQQGLADMLAAFEPFDAVVTPTTLAGAPFVDGLELADILATVATPVWNAVGFPALSVPMGFDAGGLPLSLQVTARPWAEAVTFRVGHALQARTDWHLQVPPLVAPVAA
jgi:aspartyl-tRNA(Asn)/glutamyl-tRNA(Gln) amidotransferase subunit A